MGRPGVIPFEENSVLFQASLSVNSVLMPVKWTIRLALFILNSRIWASGATACTYASGR